jgi:hypothetical protein
MINIDHSVEGNMTRKTRFVLWCIPVLLGMVAASGPAHGFRCGGRIVVEGDYAYEVIARCGEPDHVEAWQEERIKRDFYRPLEPQRKRDYELYREPLLVKEYVVIELWTYNLGRQRLTRYLRFENGKLVEITTGDYGY